MNNPAYLKNFIPLCKKNFGEKALSKQGTKIIKDVLDGNSIASYVAYGFSENSFIYPISPSSAMGDKMDQMMSDHKKNMFGQVVECLQM